MGKNRINFLHIFLISIGFYWILLLFIGPSHSYAEQITNQSKKRQVQGPKISDDSTYESSWTEAKTKVDTAGSMEPFAKFIRQSQINVLGNFSYLGISSVDQSNGAKANLYSDINYGVTGAWVAQLNDRLKLGISLGGQGVKLNSQTAVKQLEGLSWLMLGEMAIFARMKSDLGFWWGPTIQLKSQPFFWATSPIDIHVDSTIIPMTGAAAEKLINLTQKISIGLNLSAFYCLPSSTANYTISSGYALNAKFQSSFQIGKTLIQGIVYYDRLSQNTSLTNQVNSELGLFLGVGLRPFL